MTTDTTTAFFRHNQLTGEQYEWVARLVYEHSRINLGSNKLDLLSSRLSKRIRVLGMQGFDDYIRLLKSTEGPEELANLVDVVSTNHTHFFREIQHFQFLENRALPEISKHLNGESFRIWSAASSSGEEPYSLGITLYDFFAAHPQMAWSITATDISTRILDKARKAIYSEERLGPVGRERTQRYFQKGTGDWNGYFRVKKFLREKVVFHHVNLLQPSYPFSHLFHIIFCRNVMIYFDRATQEDLVGRLYKRLHPGGYLMVGHSESLTGLKHSFRPVQPAVYRKEP